MQLSTRFASSVFFTGLTLMAVTGISAYVFTERLARSELLVSHSTEVQANINLVQRDLEASDAAYRGFFLTQDADYLTRREQALNDLVHDIQEVKLLTADNYRQQLTLERIQGLLKQELDLQHEALLQPPESAEQKAALAASVKRGEVLTTTIRGQLDSMVQEEARILEERTVISSRLIERTLKILTGAFMFASVLLAVLFVVLYRELRARSYAEEELRSLTTQLLSLQDQERRRIARELHDSLGQLLASVKMNLSTVNGSESATHAAQVEDAMNTIDQAITEVRTLSYLLHPPLLDEVGLQSAIEWYCEGFAQRSGLKVTYNPSQPVERYSHSVELALFRVLQEALTNVHRHSRSTTVEVRLQRQNSSVTLEVEDNGIGLPPEKMSLFRRGSARIGVGLGGMRERVNKLGGSLTISSSPLGTCVSAKMPGLVKEPPEPVLTPSTAPARKPFF